MLRECQLVTLRECQLVMLRECQLVTLRNVTFRRACHTHNIYLLQLTLIELEFLRAIDVHELVVSTWDPNTAENKPYRRNLDAFIERFNKVSYWVASEICCVEDVRLRGILLEKFIEVAKHCHEFKNYNTTISVMSGLSLVAVRRLKRSWEV